ncbi:four helix bundle protein [Candidatus Berkelbacteria bacterium]|nr:four helix bundle protein [Candidatus Berkelbacteria bacterium]
MTNDQASITRQLPRTNVQTKREFDLEQRTLTFARRARDFVMRLSRTTANLEYGKQLIRSTGSTGANYIEANEALSKKDFVNRIRICRKEAKESGYWYQLILVGDNPALEAERQALLQEARELTLIFNAIVSKNGS